VAFDSQGRLYLSDQGNQRVLVYEIVSNTLVYSTTIGETGVPGGDDGHFNRPVSLAIDSSDRLYVADRDNKRVQRCTHAVSWACTTFYTVTDTSQGLSVGVDNSDHVYISHPSNCQVVKCDSAGSCAVLISTNPLGSSDVAVDSAGNVFLSFVQSLFGTGDYTIRKYDSSGAPLGVFAGVSGVPYTTDDEHLNAPVGVLIDSHGDIAVAAGNQLIKMEPDGDRIWAWGVPGVAGWPADGFLVSPADVAADADDTLYVADDQEVTMIRSDGTYSATLWGGCCTGPYALWFNRGVAVDPESGKIYASSSQNHVVHVYDSSLNYLTDMGEEGVAGSDNAHFSNPGNVYIDQAGNIYVSDRDNCRVQKFNRQRVYQMTFGITGECSWSFDKLQTVDDLAVDSQGRVFLTLGGGVQVYDEAGNYLTNVGGEAGGWGGVLSVDLDSAGNVYVADNFNHIIQVFAPGVPGWRQVNINGFGDRWSIGASALEAFNGELYAGAANWSEGARVWRTADGDTWAAVSEPGFSSIYSNTNGAIVDMVVHDGQLYAGTGWPGSGGQVWRSPSGSTWEAVTADGFGDSNNTAVSNFAIFENMLYAGTNNDSGAQIWRSDSGSSGSWTKVVTNGLGSPDANQVTGFAVFEGALYAAIETGQGGDAQVWRTTNGTDWTPVVTDGFGDPDNTSTGGFAEFGGFLYLGTLNDTTGGQIWRSNDGTAWTQAMGDGFGDTNNGKVESLFAFGGQLYAAINNETTGMEVWKSGDGLNWQQINPDGFGDSSNSSTLWSSSTVEWKHGLYIGTWNGANGGEVWMMLRQVFLPLVIRNH